MDSVKVVWQWTTPHRVSCGPMLMGILNVTPDSFSDGGVFLHGDRAIRHGLQLCEEGASIIDIGGESTRPQADFVSPEEELARVGAVMDALASPLKEQGCVLSIDTRRATVMERAIDAGACIVNDVSALTHDDRALPLVAACSHVSVVLMHMRGTPATMQDEPRYDDVVETVYDFLARRIDACTEAGIATARIAIDPGIGFGKTLAHNMALLRHLPRFHSLGCPLLLGASRKSLIAHLSTGEEATERLGGSVALALYGASRGVDVLRVHDVHNTAQALRITRALDCTEHEKAPPRCGE